MSLYGFNVCILRSVGMDAWSAIQLKKMELGGNQKMNSFFKQYGVDKYTDIPSKYNSAVAEVSLEFYEVLCISNPRGWMLSHTCGA